MIVWFVDCVNVWPFDGKQDVVDSVHWRAEYEGGLQPAVQTGVIQIPYKAEIAFKALDELPEADIIAWVHEQLSAAPVAPETLTVKERIELNLTRQAMMRTVTPKAVLDRYAAP